MDGDGEFPTICGTGTEDYFCGSYNFENRETRRYCSLSQRPTPDCTRMIEPDGVYRSQQRFGLYRWHIVDPVRFQQDRASRSSGWRTYRRDRPLQDDIASVAYWYRRC